MLDNASWPVMFCDSLGPFAKAYEPAGDKTGTARFYFSPLQAVSVLTIASCGDVAQVGIAEAPGHQYLCRLCNGGPGGDTAGRQPRAGRLGHDVRPEHHRGSAVGGAAGDETGGADEQASTQTH